MNQPTIEKQIELHYRNEEVKLIRQKMKRTQRIQKYVQLSTLAAMLTLFIGSSVYISLLNTDKFIVSHTINYQVRTNEQSTETNTLFLASNELLNHHYSEAINTLKDTEASDHKDWILLKANIGLEKFDEAQKIMAAIEADHEHLYYNRIDFRFKLDFYLLRVFG